MEDIAGTSQLLEMKVQKDEKQNFFDTRISTLIDKLVNRIEALKKYENLSQNISQQMAQLDKALSKIEEEYDCLEENISETDLKVSYTKS